MVMLIIAVLIIIAIINLAYQRYNLNKHKNMTELERALWRSVVIPTTNYQRTTIKIRRRSTLA